MNVFPAVLNPPILNTGRVKSCMYVVHHAKSAELLPLRCWSVLNMKCAMSELHSSCSTGEEASSRSKYTHTLLPLLPPLLFFIFFPPVLHSIPSYVLSGPTLELSVLTPLPQVIDLGGREMSHLSSTTSPCLSTWALEQLIYLALLIPLGKLHTCYKPT